MGLSKPWDPIRETGLQTLVGVDDKVAQNDYGPTVDVTVGGDQPASGKILAVLMYSTESSESGGAVITEAGTLYVMDADPNTTAGDANLTAAEWGTIIAKIAVAEGDWKEESSGGKASVAYYVDTEYPFHAVDTLYLVYYHEGATEINSAAGDQETIQCNIWYERYS